MELRQELQDKSKILEWSRHYNVDYDTPIKNLVLGVQERGYLTKPELVRLAEWKLPERWKRGEKRGKLGLVETNSPDDIEEITRNAFLATDDSNSIRCLRRLDGIGWAVGSAILHWFYEGRYPIWDRHARWSVQIDKDHCSFKRWKAYVKFCRAIADKYEVCMRTLDRALLLYSMKNNSRSC